jgi:integrase
MMASVTRKFGASGIRSPFWQAKFKGLDNRTVWLSTKLENEKKALAVAERWERAAFLATRWELTQERSTQILDQISETAKNPATIQITRNLLASLLIHSIGENLKGQNFTQFCSEWLEAKSGTVALSTYQKYNSVITQFIAFLPERRQTASVSSITSGEIERFRNTLAKTGVTATTSNMALSILRSLFNHARRQGITPSNPAEAVEHLFSDAEERRPFTQEQIKTLLETASIEWRGMILFGAHAGLRISDAANLSWENIDLQARTLSYQPRKTLRRKKPRERTVIIWLHDDLISYLESLTVSDNPNAAIFPSLAGLRAGGDNGYSNSFMRLMKQADIYGPAGIEKNGRGKRFSTLSYHSTRHFFISRLANLEVSSDLRKELVGHSSDAIHDRYTHLDVGLQRSAISRLPTLL